MTSRWIAISTAAALAGLAQAASAQDGHGDARRGKMLAETWCASCHIVEPGNARVGADRAPPFSAIVKDPAKDDAYIRRWITSSHVRMPDFDLGRREINDIVAYFDSLRR